MKRIYLSCALILLPVLVMSEDVYVTDKLKAGLYEDKSLASPIVKIVATGTQLEIIKREEKLSFVRDPSGTNGWINNEYLMAKAPNNTDVKSLQDRTAKLETRLADLKDRNIALESELKSQGKALPKDAVAHATLKKDHSALQQQFKAEKLKVGQLQIEITELRNRVGQDSDADMQYRQIKSLEEEKKTLEIQLANVLEKYGEESGVALKTSGFARSGDGFSPGFRNMIIYLAITLVLGLVGGVYLMDLLNRKRHGGFRI